MEMSELTSSQRGKEEVTSSQRGREEGIVVSEVISSQRGAK